MTEKKTNLGAIFATIKNAFKANRKNEKENVRGFDEGGSSVKEGEVETELEIDLQAKKTANLENAMQELQEYLKEIQAGEMEMLAQQYCTLGIDCSVEESENGGLTVKVASGKYQGADLLEMSAKELEKLLEEIEEEKQEEKPEPEKEEEKQEEIPLEKLEIETEKDDKKAKPMSLMPGDVVEKREEKQSLLVEKKEEKKAGKKDEKESPFKKVENGEKFDHGLGSNFSAEKSPLNRQK